MATVIFGTMIGIPLSVIVGGAVFLIGLPTLFAIRRRRIRRAFEHAVTQLPA